MRARNSPLAIPTESPCRTSIFSSPRVKVLCTSRMLTSVSMTSPWLERAPSADAPSFQFPASRTFAPAARSAGPSMTTRSPAARPAITVAGSEASAPRPHGATLEQAVRRRPPGRSRCRRCHGSPPAAPGSCAVALPRPARRRSVGRRVAQEGDLDAHVGEDPRIERVEADPHLHGRLLAIGRRDDGDDVRGVRFVGIGVERRPHLLPGTTRWR